MGREKKTKKDVEGKRRRGRKKGGEKKREIFPAFRRSKLDSLRIKVDPCTRAMCGVPKSGSFVKL